ncbi:pyridoxal phosphate-dependent aminotransferase [Gemmatimonadota bacterium]
MESQVNLTEDTPALLERRRFLTLLGAGAAVGAATTIIPACSAPGGSAAVAGGAVAKLNQNENAFAPSAVERQAMVKALDLANRYPGAEDMLIEGLAAHHGIDGECFLMGCGSTELLKVCAEATLDGTNDLVQGFPTYPTLERYARVYGAGIRSVPVDGTGHIDLAGLASQTGPRTGVVYLCNPNNPTGTVLPDAMIRDFIDGIPGQALIVCDEAYHEFVDDPAYASLVDLAVSRQNLVVLRTFSKVYGLAGMRIGYAIGHPDTIVQLAPFRLSINLNNPGLYAAIAALKDHDFVRESVVMNARSREAIIREMPRFGGTPGPSQAGFVWIDFGRETEPIQRALADRNVFLRTYGHSPQHLRISTGRPEDMDRLFQAMEEITGS